MVICSAGFTVTVRLCGALTAAAKSVTVAVKLNGVVVATEGAVPERMPEGASTKDPGGRPVPCQRSGGVPPVAERVWLYATPDVVGGSDVVVTEGVGLMVSEKDFVENADRLSVTIKVKVAGTAAGGVPLSKPDGVMVSHAGFGNCVLDRGHSGDSRLPGHCGHRRPCCDATRWRR